MHQPLLKGLHLRMNKNTWEDLEGGKQDLVGGFLHTKWIISPIFFRDEHKKSLSCHHLEMDVDVLKDLPIFTQIQHQYVVGSYIDHQNQTNVGKYIHIP